MEILTDIVTSGLMAVLTTGGGIALSKINTTVKKVNSKIDDIQTTVNNHQKLLKNSLDSNEVCAEIDSVEKDALELLVGGHKYYSDSGNKSKDLDPIILSLISTQADIAKIYYNFVITLGFNNVSCTQLKAKYVGLAQRVINELEEVRDLDFYKVLRNRLSTRGKQHLDKVIAIKKDNQWNSKNRRFKIETLSTLNDCIAIIINEYSKRL